MQPPDLFDRPDVPDLAALARTAVACARAATVTTYPRSAALRPQLTTAGVTAGTDGSVVVRLAAGGLAAQMLLARPLATVQLAPRACESVTIHGAARRQPAGPGSDGDAGLLAFRIEPAAVRVGPRGHRSVAAAAYAAAAPDPLRHQAPDALEHLNSGHREALAACLRALGHDVETADARRLDQDGLSVTAVGMTGVSSVRLAFPRRVERLEDLPQSLAGVLLCRCAYAGSPDADRR